MAPATLWVRRLGRQAYLPVWQAMQHYTACRDHTSHDELWLLEHDPVFTQGQAGKAEHLLMPGDIPVIQADRGGQVTYHGPGQLVGYVLVDLRRLGVGVRDLVSAIENSLVTVLADLGLAARPRPDAPGVYLASGAKIAQLGLRVRRGCSFHGLSLNVNMDLSVFQRINPCGYAGMAVTDIASQPRVNMPDWATLESRVAAALANTLGYQNVQECGEGLPSTEEVK